MQIQVTLGEPVKCPTCKGNEVEHRRNNILSCIWYCYRCKEEFERILKIKSQNDA